MDLISTDGKSKLAIDAGLGGFHKATLSYDGQVLGVYDKQHLADLMQEFEPCIKAKADVLNATSPTSAP
jgi:hypothetical protein